MNAAVEPRDVHQLIDAQAGAPLSTDDIAFLCLPLLRAVATLHQHGRGSLIPR